MRNIQQKNEPKREHKQKHESESATLRVDHIKRKKYTNLIRETI